MTELLSDVGTIKALPVLPKHPYANCDGCPLYETGDYVPSTFPSKACSTGNQLAFIGEAPGENEVKRSKIFIGESGKVLDGTLGLLGIERGQALMTNASACHYPKEQFDKLPKAAVDHCRPRLLHELSEVGVQTAVTLGAHAMRALIDTTEGITIGRAGGPRRSDFIENIVVVPTFHPAFAMRDHTVFPLLLSDIRKVNDGIWDKWEDPRYRVIQTEAAAAHEIVRLWHITTEPIEVDTESGADKDDTFGGAIKDVLCIGLWDESTSEVLVFPREVFNDTNRKLMGKLFMRNGISGQNLKYDIGRVLNVFLGVDGLLDIRIKGDRMLQSYALRSGIRGIHGLDYMGREILGTPRWKHWTKDSMEEGRRQAKAGAKARGERIGKRFEGLNYAFIDREILYKYNAYDVAVTRRLRDHFEPEVAAYDGLPALYDRLLDYSHMLTHVEQRGMLIDEELNTQLERELNEELDGLKFGGMPDEFNPRSVPQVKKFLELTGLQIEDTRARTIKGLVDYYKVTGERPEIVDFCTTLLKSRDLGKQLSTYVVGLRKTLIDWVAHPDYSLMSSTGRLKARAPNSQNCPHGSRLRGQYIARPGKILIQADYKQAELRVMAWLAKDYTLRAMFATPGDLFTDMCRDIYSDYDTKSAVERGILRKLIKTIAYGTAYNRGASAIALEFGVSISRARKIQADFNAKIPEVIKYRDGIMDIAVNCGDLVTVFGRRRQFRLVTDQNWHDVRNEAAAHMPQSTANDICLTSAVELDKMGLPIVNLIHDAIIAEVDIGSDEQEAEHLMRKVMVGTAEEVTEHFVKWEVDIAKARSYGDFKG